MPTALNGAAVGDDGQLLEHGDTVSLGPSNVSTYTVVRIEEEGG